MQHPRTISAVMVAIIALAGCSGGGGGGQSTSSGPSDPASTSLGSREMPDGVISVSMRGDDPGTLVVETSPGYPAVASVSAGWVADGEPPASAQALPMAERLDDHRFGLAAAAAGMRSRGAGGRYLVRIEHVDGSVIESGREDFRVP